MNKQLNLFSNNKYVEKQNPKSKSEKNINNYNNFQRQLKPLLHQLGGKKILNILRNYQRVHQKRHRKPRINVNRKKYALDEVINYKQGKYSLNISEIARRHHIARMTLWRWYRDWKNNPNRANKTMLFTNHQITKNKKK